MKVATKTVDDKETYTIKDYNYNDVIKILILNQILGRT